MAPVETVVVPFGQREQIADPGTLAKLPKSHSVHAVKGAVEYDPSLQGAQVGLPGACATVPALHAAQVDLSIANSAELAVPAGHARQSLSVDPGTKPYVPFGQLTHVARVPLPTALLKVPAGHNSHIAAPPAAEKVPGAQEKQVVAPTKLTDEPGAQGKQDDASLVALVMLPNVPTGQEPLHAAVESELVAPQVDGGQGSGAVAPAGQ